VNGNGFRTRWRTLTALLAFAGLAVLISACGATSGGSSSSSEGGGEASPGGETVSNSGGSGEKPLTEVPTEGEMVETGDYKAEPPWTIGYADSSMSNSWRVFAWQYMQAEAAAHPQIGEVIHANANESASKQVSDIENLLSRNVNCLIVAPTSATALSPAITAASKQVPVVINERAVDNGEYTTFASLEAKEMGEIQAEAVVKALNGKGKIVIMEGVEGTGPVIETLEGMEKVLGENPGIEVLATEYTEWSRDKGKQEMENLLQANPEIDAVLSDSGLQNVGIFEAVKQAGRLDEIKAWTGDTVQGWLRIVQKENLPGVIVDRPTIVGAEAVATCVAILEGKPVPKKWATPNKVIQPGEIAKYIAPNETGSEEWWDWWDLPKKWLPSGA
jgi:ribose transport system substrate-binding protein